MNQVFEKYGKYGLYLLIATCVFFYGRQHHYATSTLLFLALLSVDSFKDRKNISWLRFLPVGGLLMAFFYFTYRNAPGFWQNIVLWELKSNIHLFNWNETFQHIPLNDGWMFRLWQPSWLTSYFRWVYATGFTLSLWAAIFRSFLAKDARKMAQYALSGHILQLPIIIVFYLTIMLQEVWYVNGDPDGMNRHFTPQEAVYWTQNCFPSMHTSVAFAILLVALREKGKLFKYLMVTYCASIILSTLYLEIHWVLDVFGGMLLAFGTVKLADFILSKTWKMDKKEKENNPDIMEIANI